MNRRGVIPGVLGMNRRVVIPGVSYPGVLGMKISLCFWAVGGRRGFIPGGS